MHAPDHLLDAAACADLAAGCALMPWGDAEGARKTSGGARGNTRTRGEKGPPPRTKWTRRVPHPVLIGREGNRVETVEGGGP